MSELELVAREAAREVLAMYKEQEKQKQRKEILHNTNELLKRYLDIKDYLRTAKCHYIVNSEEIWLKSIFRSKATTRFLVSHVDTSIEILGAKHPDLTRIIKIIYTDEQCRNLSWEEKIANLAVDMCMSERNVARWRGRAVDELSIILFGADGLRLWTI